MATAIPVKTKFSEVFVRKLEPRERAYLVWDLFQRGLAVQVQTTGHKSWKCIYSINGRKRWYTIGNAEAVGLADARKHAAEVAYKVVQGGDPCADKKAARGQGTFEETAARYRDEYAKRHNKSWRQADALVERYLMPRWAKLQARDVTRQDVKLAILAITAPILANQVRHAASAIFKWALREEIVLTNPCTLIELNPTSSRDRVLSTSELPRFWQAFDMAGLYKSATLKMILLTGQRPGEVRHMRREHIVDGWWELPGQPDPTLDWPGTKNGQNHRVWLPQPALRLLSEMPEGEGQIFRAIAVDAAMRSVCAELAERAESNRTSVPDRVTPHDLRRTHGTTITALGFGRDAMNRIQNHIDGGIGSVYDRHQYADENKRIMESVAKHIISAVSLSRPLSSELLPLFGE
jgi:integrase